jgi:hypothetical protein
MISMIKMQKESWYQYCADDVVSVKWYRSSGIGQVVSVKWYRSSGIDLVVSVKWYRSSGMARSRGQMERLRITPRWRGQVAQSIRLLVIWTNWRIVANHNDTMRRAPY